MKVVLGLFHTITVLSDENRFNSENSSLEKNKKTHFLPRKKKKKPWLQQVGLRRVLEQLDPNRQMKLNNTREAYLSHPKKKVYKDEGRR